MANIAETVRTALNVVINTPGRTIETTKLVPSGDAALVENLGPYIGPVGQARLSVHLLPSSVPDDLKQQMLMAINNRVTEMQLQKIAQRNEPPQSLWDCIFRAGRKDAQLISQRRNIRRQ